MNIRSRALVVCAFAGLTLAACGSSGSDAGSSTKSDGSKEDSAKTTTTEAKVEAVEPTLLDVDAVGTAADANGFTDYASDPSSDPVDFAIPCGGKASVTVTGTFDGAGDLSDGSSAFATQWIIVFPDEDAAAAYVEASGEPDCPIGSDGTVTTAEYSGTEAPDWSKLPVDEVVATDVTGEAYGTRVTARSGKTVSILQTDLEPAVLAELLGVVYGLDGPLPMASDEGSDSSDGGDSSGEDAIDVPDGSLEDFCKTVEDVRADMPEDLTELSGSLLDLTIALPDDTEAQTKLQDYSSAYSEAYEATDFETGSAKLDEALTAAEAVCSEG